MMSRINTSVRAEKQISDRNGNTSKQTKKIRRGLRETTQCLLSNGIREICEIRA